MGMCKQNEYTHHPEIPVKTSASDSKCTLVCIQLYSPHGFQNSSRPERHPRRKRHHRRRIEVHTNPLMEPQCDSSSFRHLSQRGSSVNSNLKRCPFRWQCPVSSPTAQLNWSLFSFNRSFVLLAEGICISPFACVSPVTESQYASWFLLVQSLTAFLATLTEMPQAGSGPMNGCSDPILTNWSAASFPTIPSWPGTHISWTLDLSEFEFFAWAWMLIASHKEYKENKVRQAIRER
jgi:hypothetical protein